MAGWGQCRGGEGGGNLTPLSAAFIWFTALDRGSSAADDCSSGQQSGPSPDSMIGLLLGHQNNPKFVSLLTRLLCCYKSFN